MAYSYQSPYGQPYHTSPPPPPQAAGSSADYYGSGNPPWPGTEGQPSQNAHTGHNDYYGGQYAPSGPPSSSQPYGYTNESASPYAAYQSPASMGNHAGAAPHGYPDPYGTVPPMPQSSPAPLAGSHYQGAPPPGQGYVPAYQDDLVARMAQTNISSHDQGLSASPYGHAAMPPPPGHAIHGDINYPQVQGDDQRGMGSMVAGGVVGGVGVYAAQKIHQRYGSSSSSPPPAAGKHSSGKWPLGLPAGSKITFDHFPNGVEKDKKMGKIKCYSVVEPGTPASQPYYSYTFVDDKRWRKHPGLWVSHHKDRKPKDGRKVCKATYREGGPLVEIWHPWTDWDGKWDPQREVWLSDTGTLNGQEFIWDYHWEDRPKKDKKAWHTIRCQFNEDEAEEVCRITMYQIDHGKIEIPADIIKSQEGLDEMVSNACIQIQRWQNEWSYAPEDV